MKWQTSGVRGRSQAASQSHDMADSAKATAVASVEQLLVDNGESDAGIATVVAKLLQPDTSLDTINVLRSGPTARAVQKLKSFAGLQAAGISSNQVERLVKEVAGAVAVTHSMCQMLLFQQFCPVSSSCSSKALKANYRETAISFYHPDVDVKASPRLRCMLTGQEFKNDEVVAAHIYQRGWPSDFRKVMGFKIHDPGNLLLLVAAAEKKLDQFQWTLKPLPPEMQEVDGVARLMQPYKVLVLCPGLLNSPRQQLIADHLCSVKWADVQGKLLWFGAGEDEAKPLRRVCGLHAMLAIRHAQSEGWLDMTGLPPRMLSDEDLAIDEAAWASPTFNKANMDAFLSSLPDPGDYDITF